MQRLILPFALLMVVFGIGVGWYWRVEDIRLLDAVYQSVITLSTVGFAEVEPLDDSGRIFTIGFILAGIGLMLYVASALVEFVVAGEIRAMVGRRRSQRRVQRMENHVIVCGYGRVGIRIASELSQRGVDVVIVDTSSEALEAASETGAAVLLGDATEEPVLRAAHIERARALVAAADSDTGNTYIVLTARALNPDLFIVGRTGSPSAERRMKTAGADRVISPYQIAGQRMAMSIVQPLMLDFVDLLRDRETPDEKILTEIRIGKGSQLDGQTIAEAFQSTPGVSLLGVEHHQGEIVIGPKGSEVLHGGDRMMMYGPAEALEQLSETHSD